MTKVTNNNKRPSLRVCKPKTINQNKIFSEFEKDKHIFIHGCAGTGKTFCALYVALDAVLNKQEYDEIVIIRSTVPSRKQGFLPGNEEEKNEIYEIPYEVIINNLFNSNMYRFLKNERKIRFLSTSYLRGTTIDNAVIIVDEVQNFSGQEINTVMTRIGDNCKVLICGDTDQNDLLGQKEDSCIEDFYNIIERMKSFTIIEMTIKDMCRNNLVSEWIIARNSNSNSLPRFLR